MIAERHMVKAQPLFDDFRERRTLRQRLLALSWPFRALRHIAWSLVRR